MPLPEKRHPSTQAWLDLFEFHPMSGHYQAIIEQIRTTFKDLAEYIVEVTPNNNQQTVFLGKLMEAKDAAVRAVVLEGQRAESEGSQAPVSGVFNKAQH